MAIAVALVACTDDGSDSGSDSSDASTTTTIAAPAATRALTITTENAPDLPGFTIYRPEDLDATGGPLPVIVWANGGCYRFDVTWQPLLERWATAGFFIIAISGDRAPAGNSTAADQAAAIDWAVDHSERATGPYAGRLDIDRIVAAGNSCGGITSLNLAAGDDRVTAVFVLSGSSVGPGASTDQVAAVMGNVEVPVGYAVGGVEDIAGAEAIKDYDALPPGVPAYIAARSSGDHVLVSTEPEILADVADIAINWFDLTLYGRDAARRTLLHTACDGCPPGLWTPTAKRLGSLVQGPG
jgi:hypothetical protein